MYVFNLTGELDGICREKIAHVNYKSSTKGGMNNYSNEIRRELATADTFKANSQVIRPIN